MKMIEENKLSIVHTEPDAQEECPGGKILREMGNIVWTINFFREEHKEFSLFRVF